MNQHELTTVWGETLDRTDPLPEYPRPQLVRSSFLSLNGRWQCAFTGADAPAPEHYDMEILVPFSPEAPLSGVMRQLHEPTSVTVYVPSGRPTTLTSVSPFLRTTNVLKFSLLTSYR